MSEDSLLFSTVKIIFQMRSYSKAPGVFLSQDNQAASSQPSQFRRVNVQDSYSVILPFVRVGTHPTRNFATIEQLQLLLPFTGALIRDLLLTKVIPQSLTYQHWAGVSPYTLPFGFAGTYVLDKQLPNTLLLNHEINRGRASPKGYAQLFCRVP